MSKQREGGASETAADVHEQDLMTPRGESLESLRQQRAVVDAAIEGDIYATAPSVSDAPVKLVVGIAAIAVGLAAVVGAVALPEIPFRVPALIAASVITASVGAFLLARRAFTGTVQADPADVEYRESVVVPGVEFDRVLDGAIRGMGSRRVKARGEIVDRVTRAAVVVVAQAERIDLGRARERVADGTWTDNEVAARFLSSEGSVVSSTGDLLRTAAGQGSKLSATVDEVVRELGAVTAGIEFADAGDGGNDDPTGEGAGDGGATDERSGDEADADAPSGSAERPGTTDTTGFERVERDRRTGRWRGLTGLALIALGVGLFTSGSTLSPALVVAAAAVVGTAGYVYLSDPPDLSATVERSLSTDEAAPGEAVVVTVTLTNDGDAMLPDLRVVDGVPPALRVTDGSPRFATALRPGESVTFSYSVAATRGQHVFDPAHVVVRDFSGAVERERHVDSEAPTVLSCPLELVATEEVPVHPHTARRVGRVSTDTGGSGVELHSVREYRRGDPLARIDWNRVASTGEFATLQFREEHAATVVLLIDARAEAHVAPRVDAPSALEHGIEAADVVLSSLVSAGDSVGLAALSPERCWLAPRGGRSQQARARRLLETHPAFDGRRPEGTFHGGFEERRLRRELPADAQLVLFSPLCDDDAVEIARGLHAREYPVTVISPDVAGDGSTGQRLAAVERAIRISRLRRSGVRVVGWETDRPLQSALDAAQRRWSA